MKKVFVFVFIVAVAAYFFWPSSGKQAEVADSQSKFVAGISPAVFNFSPAPEQAQKDNNIRPGYVPEIQNRQQFQEKMKRSGAKKLATGNGTTVININLKGESR